MNADRPNGNYEHDVAFFVSQYARWMTWELQDGGAKDARSHGPVSVAEAGYPARAEGAGASPFSRHGARRYDAPPDDLGSSLGLVPRILRLLPRGVADQMSIWRDDPFMRACERLAEADPEAFGTVLGELYDCARPGLTDPPSYSRVALGRVEGTLMAASTFLPKGVK